MHDSADYSKGKAFPLILKFSVPAAASLLITAIYNIVDRIFVGNFCGTTELAALSVCFPLSFIMIAFGLMCSAGGATLFTLYRGAGQPKDANTAFWSAFSLTIAFEIILTMLLLLFQEPLLGVFGVTETTFDFAKAYYVIVSLGCVFQGLTLVFCDFVRVSGKPVVGMLVTGVGAVTNIILDALFVAGFGWGVEGAAWATVIGQVLSVAFGLYLVLSGKTLVSVKREDRHVELGISKNCLAVVLHSGLHRWQ